MNTINKSNVHALDDYIFFVTPPHSCSYLEHETAQMIFLDPSLTVTSEHLSELSRNGFRRSGQFIYRPECPNCRGCLSSRINISQFKPNSSQRRSLKAYADLRFETRPCRYATAVHYALFERYITARHAGGDMFPPSVTSFRQFIATGGPDSFFMEFWRGDKLIAVSVNDLLDDGVSAVYSFYEPSRSKHSLGTYLILKQIDYAKQVNLPYVYLGYWIKNSRKMGYKANFSGLEICQSNFEWTPLTQLNT